MGAAPAAGKAELQQMLQSAVQAVQWTYIIFWRFCPQQGALVWSEGYYNGAIKTRKTVQPMEVSAEEASLERSQQLRELYDALSAEEANPHQQPPKRPSAALSPEDLTETEWFYLMCVSFSFAPAVGLPGKAYVKRQHVWLTGAHEVDSKVFSRAILAKSARVQTVVCIPVMDGVVELGSTERLKEDPSLVQHVKSLFVEQRRLPPSKPVPTLSEQSTSNPAVRFPIYSPAIHHLNEEDNGKFNGGAVECDSGVGQQGPSSQAHVAAELSELMQVEMSEDIRLGSPDSPTRCPLLHHHQLQLPPPSASGVGVMEEEELAGEEDAHYSQTVSSILQYQTARRWAQVSPAGASTVQSAFSKWTPGAAERDVHLPDAHSSQSLLKYILLSVPFLHSTSCKESPIEKSSNRGGFHGNHVLAERRRREKLNERFIILRSLVPFVTKMDKASILADTIDYLKHLRRKINELEARAPKPNNTSSGLTLTERAQPQSKSCGSAKPKPAPAPAQADMLQVSIIEIDALIELQCPYREGLLLDIMVVLREMHLEVTAVNSSFSNSFFTAHLRAKVRENVNGKKASIVQVKTAIAQIVPHSHHL